MNKIFERIHNVVRSMACNMVDQETREWPPKCLVLIYQPKRPETNSKEDNNSSEE